MTTECTLVTLIGSRHSQCTCSRSSIITLPASSLCNLPWWMCFFFLLLSSTLYIFMNLVLYAARMGCCRTPYACNRNKHVPVKIHLLHTNKTQSYTTRFTYIRIYNIIGIVKRKQFNNYNKSSLSELYCSLQQNENNRRAKGIEKIINYLNGKHNNKSDSCCVRSGKRSGT